MPQRDISLETFYYNARKVYLAGLLILFRCNWIRTAFFKKFGTGGLENRIVCELILDFGGF
jgi:hypothetical protein